MKGSGPHQRAVPAAGAATAGLRWLVAGTVADTTSQQPQLRALQAAIMTREVNALVPLGACELADDVAGIV